MSINGMGSFNAASIKQFQDQLFSKMDANGDGTVTEAEFDAYNQQIEQATGQTIDSSAIWSKLDPNGTGSVTEAQFEANLPAPPTPTFSDSTQSALIQLQAQNSDGNSSTQAGSLGNSQDGLQQLADQLVADLEQAAASQSGSSSTSGSGSSTSTTAASDSSSGTSTSSDQQSEMQQLANELLGDIEQAIANQGSGTSTGGTASTSNATAADSTTSTSTATADTSSTASATGATQHAHHHHHHAPDDDTQSTSGDATSGSSDAATQLLAQLNAAIAQYSANSATTSTSGSQLSLAA